MNKKNIEIHINNAIKATTPNIYDQVSSVFVERLKEDNIMNKKNIFNNFKVYKLAGAFAVFAICIMAAFGLNNMNHNKVDTVIGIDVNPSIELKVNDSDEVIDVVALNDDALKIIDGMELKNVDLNTTLNAIIGSMVKNGFISELKNEILVSVENDDEDRSEEIKDTVVADINSILAEKEIIGVIFSQPITVDKDLKDTAEAINTSVGKAAFLKKLVANNPSLSIDELATMTLHEISDYMKANNIDISNIVDHDDIEEADEDKQEESTSEVASEAETEEAETEDADAEEADAEESEAGAKEAAEKQAEKKLELAADALKRGEVKSNKKLEQAKKAEDKGNIKQAEKKTEQANQATERAKNQAEKKTEQALKATERAKELTEDVAEQTEEVEQTTETEQTKEAAEIAKEKAEKEAELAEEAEERAKEKAEKEAELAEEAEEAEERAKEQAEKAAEQVKEAEERANEQAEKAAEQAEKTTQLNERKSEKANNSDED
jgi:hypothetical protein